VEREESERHRDISPRYPDSKRIGHRHSRIGIENVQPRRLGLLDTLVSSRLHSHVRYSEGGRLIGYGSYELHKGGQRRDFSMGILLRSALGGHCILCVCYDEHRESGGDYGEEDYEVRGQQSDRSRFGGAGAGTGGAASTSRNDGTSQTTGNFVRVWLSRCVDFSDNYPVD